jgi:RecA/RadA recombinase/tetratricopeptide (TPR) repeat protein
MTVKAESISDDPTITDLAHFIEVDLMDWTAELTQREALLALLPESIVPAGTSLRKKAKVLHQLLMKVVDRAYFAMKDSQGTDGVAAVVFAVGISTGLVTELPQRGYTNPPSKMTMKRSSGKSERQESAAGFLENDERTFRRNKQKYLKIFRDELLTVLDDEQVVLDHGVVLPGPLVQADDPPSNRVTDACNAAQSDTALLTLTDLLEAQVAVASDLYSPPFMQDVPSSDQCYVELGLKQAGADDWKAPSLHLDAALEKGRHVAIIGQAGSGKTTLAVQTVARLSKALLVGGLDESSWVPIYVPARSLIGPRGFSELVTTAVCANLSGLLSSSPDAGTFAVPPPEGQGWLIFIDGMDEIVKEGGRCKLTKTLVRHFDSAHLRFVILGRRLDKGIKSINEPFSLAIYELAPFDEWQLTHFCRSWFRANGMGEAHGHHLLRQAEHKGIYDLLNNPLLASMACSIYATSTEHELPTTIIDLYEGFIDYLLFRRLGQETVRDHIRSLLAAYGSRGNQAATWLYDHRRELSTYVVMDMLDCISDRARPLKTALQFVRASYADFSEELEWRDVLEDVLLSTGLFFRRGPELTYVHKALVEYLVAPVEGLHDLTYGYSNDPGEWYLYNRGDGRQNFANLILLWWAKQPPRKSGPRHNWPRRPGGSEPMLRKLLSSATELIRHDIAELVSYSDISLNSYLIDPIIEFYSGPYRILTEEEYLYRLGSHYQGFGFDPDGLEIDVNAILGRLARMSSRVADLLLQRTFARDVYHPARLEGLGWLLRTKHRPLTENHLQRFLASDNAKRWLDTAEVYLAAGDIGRALEIARWDISDAGQLWRAGQIMFKCGERDEALARLSDAFSLCSEWKVDPSYTPYSHSAWNLRGAIAWTMASFGYPEQAIDLLRETLSRHPAEEREQDVIHSLSYSGFSELAEEELQRVISTGVFHLNSESQSQGIGIHYSTQDPETCQYAPGCRAIASRNEFSVDFTKVKLISVALHIRYLQDHVIRDGSLHT